MSDEEKKYDSRFWALYHLPSKEQIEAMKNGVLPDSGSSDDADDENEENNSAMRKKLGGEQTLMISMLMKMRSPVMKSLMVRKVLMSSNNILMGQTMMVRMMEG